MQANSKITKRCIRKTFTDNFTSSQQRNSTLTKVKLIIVQPAQFSTQVQFSKRSTQTICHSLSMRGFWNSIRRGYLWGLAGDLQVDLTAKYGWRRLHHKMTGGGRIWRRCFKIASETVKYSPKCRGIRRINVAIRRTFVYRPLYMYNVYHFHQSCRFFNEFTVSGATGTSY
jgi:hypothetical protein